jgi:starch-binding outer membrane protein, SusD/RagB family
MKIMKNRIIIYCSLFTGILIAVAACKKSFLTVQPQGTLFQSNYYQNPTEAFDGVIAAYNPLAWTVVSSYCPKMVLFNAASDDAYAGGGGTSDNPGIQALNTFTLQGATPNVLPDLWSRNYTGINRVNTMLEELPLVPGLVADTLTRYTAEMHFLRAYYYFDLVREFGNIPLITTVLQQSQWFSQVQVKPAVIYAQIEADLNAAIPNLPATINVATDGGRATKGAAQALLGKAIIYENNTGRMQEAAAHLDSVNTSPNYHLLPNFGDIFNPLNKFNAESVFEVVHTSAAGRNWSNGFNFDDGNIGVQMVGARGYKGPVYESNAAGYGFNPITLDLVNFMKNDPRYPFTIVNMDSLRRAGFGQYDTTGYQNTGYFVAKFAPLAQYQGTVGNLELNWTNDEIEIRLADTYLLEAEALVRGGGSSPSGMTAQNFLDAVRARVGLPSIPATIDNIYTERRLELATEGSRYFDLVRTGQAGTVLASKGFKTGTNEILPIPLQELNNTKLVQNPGYN